MTHSMAFKSVIQSAEKGDILIGPLRAYLGQPEFSSFQIEVFGLGTRKPDYWFHPSTHPSFNPRELWLWMAAPDLLNPEPRDASATLAMTAGSIWHEIIETSLMHIGMLETNEIRFKDEETKARGAADGLIAAHSGQSAPSELLEFKTAKDMIVRQLTDLDSFKAKYPKYVLQANEYMRLSGYRKVRFLVMALTYPFEMREFLLEYDPFMADDVANKYRAALQHVADGTVPECSGCLKKTYCEARPVCESASQETLVSIVSGNGGN